MWWDGDPKTRVGGSKSVQGELEVARDGCWRGRGRGRGRGRKRARGRAKENSPRRCIHQEGPRAGKSNFAGEHLSSQRRGKSRPRGGVYRHSFSPHIPQRLGLGRHRERRARHARLMHPRRLDGKLRTRPPARLPARPPAFLPVRPARPGGGGAPPCLGI